MKNECHIVRDLMPLYTEGMLSNESAAFVKTHLETCEDCRGAYSGEETPPVTEADTAQQRAGEAGVLRTLKKKLRKQTWCAIIITVAVVLLVTLMLRLNSIDYLADISATKGYTFSDRMALLFKGGISDRTQAQRVLNNNVYAAFLYSEKEACGINNVAEEDVPSYYGALRHYFVREDHAGETLTTYHIDLLSAHFGSKSGKMWVKYEYDRYDKSDNLRWYEGTGGTDRIALWKLEKNDDGYWCVVEIVNTVTLDLREYFLDADEYDEFTENTSWYAG